MREARSNALAVYMNDVGKVPLLTREQETTLAIRAKEGDISARNQIVSANLRFVMQIAKRYRGQGLPYEDLVSEGNIGLLTAIDRFDPSLGYHFISYAVHWITQSILKALCETSRTIRLPANKVGQLMKIEKAKRDISADLQGAGETAAIAREAGLDDECVEELMRLSAGTVSLESSVRGKDKSAFLSDFVEDKRRATPEDEAIYASMQDDIENALEMLNEKEAEVLRLRYGLCGNAALSLKELGDKFDLTKERVRQIEKRAIGNLRACGKAHKLRAFVA